MYSIILFQTKISKIKHGRKRIKTLKYQQLQIVNFLRQVQSLYGTRRKFYQKGRKSSLWRGKNLSRLKNKLPMGSQAKNHRQHRRLHEIHSTL